MKRAFVVCLNVLSVVAVLVLTWAAVGRYVETLRPPPTIAAGDEIRLSGVNWPVHGKTVILALQPECPQCLSSMPFYRDLVRSNGNESFHALAIFNHYETVGRAMLEAHGLEIGDVRGVDFDVVQVSGTPMVIVVGPDGRVDAAWSGRLTREEENEVFAQLQVRRLAVTPTQAVELTEQRIRSLQFEQIDVAEFARLYRRVPVIDTRERADFALNHVVGSVNIPVLELEARLAPEVPRQSGAVLLCNFCPECVGGTKGVALCDSSLEALAHLNFGDTRVFLAHDITAQRQAGVELAP